MSGSRSWKYLTFSLSLSPPFFFYFISARNISLCSDYTRLILAHKPYNTRKSYGSYPRTQNVLKTVTEQLLKYNAPYATCVCTCRTYFMCSHVRTIARNPKDTLMYSPLPHWDDRITDILSIYWYVGIYCMIHSDYIACHINHARVYMHFSTWEPTHVPRERNISINRDNTRKSASADSHVRGYSIRLFVEIYT